MPLNYTLEKTVQMASSIYAYFQQLKAEKEERKPIVYSGRHPMKTVSGRAHSSLWPPLQRALEHGTDALMLRLSQHSGRSPGIPFPVLISRPD